MRKYFLLSAVALLATTTANATTDYAEVTAKATVQLANQMTCGDSETGVWNLGTLVIKKNNEYMEPPINTSGNGTFNHDDLISHTGYESLYCAASDGAASVDISVPYIIDLSNGTSTIALRVGETRHGDPFDGELWVDGDFFEIPDNVTAGEYTASFTISATY